MHSDTFIQTDFQVGKVPLDGPFGNRTQVDQYLFLSPDFLFVCYIYIYNFFKASDLLWVAYDTYKVCYPPVECPTSNKNPGSGPECGLGRGLPNLSIPRAPKEH